MQHIDTLVYGLYFARIILINVEPSVEKVNRVEIETRSILCSYAQDEHLLQSKVE